MNYKNKILMICCIIGAVLIITNPSLKLFKEYLGVSYSSGIARKSNYFVFSKFRNRNKNYLGALWNFFPLDKNVISENSQKVLVTDTLANSPIPETTIEYKVQGNDFLDNAIRNVLSGQNKKHSHNDVTSNKVDSILKGIKK